MEREHPPTTTRNKTRIDSTTLTASTAVRTTKNLSCWDALNDRYWMLSPNKDIAREPNVAKGAKNCGSIQHLAFFDSSQAKAKNITESGIVANRNSWELLIK